MKAGLITAEQADFTLHGLECSFVLGVGHAKMVGRRVHKNYASAYANVAKVHTALAKRVAAGKKLRLRSFLGQSVELPRGSGTMLAQDAVPKKLKPNSVRPFSDHTKTGFNGSVDMSAVWSGSLAQHVQRDRRGAAARLLCAHRGRVLSCFELNHRSEHVAVYVRLVVRCERPLEEQDGPNTLYVHTFADFGTAPLPAIWDQGFAA